MPAILLVLLLAAGAATAPVSPNEAPHCAPGDLAGCKVLAERASSGLRRDVAAGLVDALRVGCKAGSADACAGWMVAEPARTGEVPADALAQLDKACSGGSALGCSLQAEFRLRRASGPEAIAPIVAQLETWCQKMGSSPCFTLASMYREGAGVKADEKREATYLERACKTGSAYACFQDGMRRSESGEDEGARESYERGCDAGLPQPCFNLGFLLLHGKGGGPDPARGRALIASACRWGDGSACDYLAATDEGQREPSGGPLDDKGLALARRYCELGGSDACAAAAFHLGDRVEHSNDLSGMDEVIGLLQVACSRESVRSCNALGHLAKDAVAGCEKGQGQECLVAGFVRTRGTRMPSINGPSYEADKDAARAAFQRACKLDIKAGCERAR